MQNSIVARGISKKYRLGSLLLARTLLRERLAAAIKAPFGGGKEAAVDDDDFWALRDVSFDIAEGEIVGLIGRNGAGKSTLLRILSEITEPTEGEAHLHGKVASLLEVGIGFHPELTGRENVYLNGAILGMTRHETRAKFDEIVQFAEVEKFLDTPVKRYSSGMYVRLAFAVAAHLDPDILIIDEVLAVGDLAFQQKCLRKIRNIREQGRTVIIVSHAMSTVTSLCERAIWLDQGSVKKIGNAVDVVTAYVDEGIVNDVVWIPRFRDPLEFDYHSVTVVRGDNGAAADSVPADVGVDIVFDFEIKGILAPGRLLIRVHNDYGEVLFTSTSTDGTGQRAHAWTLGRQKMRCRIPGNLLQPGRYSISVSRPRGNFELLHENVVTFTINEQNSLVERDGRDGKISPLLEWANE
jgi:lipopolysaccharide transport system ATP-binding protein